MTVNDLIKFFSARNIPQLAEKSPFKKPTLYYWYHHGIPIEQQALIEIGTNGKLKANKKLIPKLKGANQ